MASGRFALVAGPTMSSDYDDNDDDDDDEDCEAYTTGASELLLGYERIRKEQEYT